MKLIVLLFIAFTTQGKEFKSLGMKLNFDYLKLEEDSPIWGLDFIDKNNIIYTTQKGKIYIFNTVSQEKNQLSHNIKNIKTKGQGGLLDILIADKIVYVTFSQAKDNQSRTALAKANLNLKKLDFKVIFKTKTLSSNNHHYGSRVLIDSNSLYMTVGERGERNKAQNLNYHNGKVLKLNIDGSFNKEGSIFSHGHRNPQGITSYKNKIYVGEFGPQGGDEINILKKDANYGWPKVTYGKEYSGGKIGKKEGFTMPTIFWKPSISFSGINVYTGSKLTKWNGHLFLACLASTHLRRVNLSDYSDQEEILKDLSERFRMVRMSPDEKIYVTFDSGKIGVISN